MTIQTSMKIIFAALSLFVLLIAGACVFVFSGMYDVSAMSSHGRLAEWAFATTMQHSVRARAREIQVPDLSSSMATRGMEHYAENCEPCHGAPGVGKGEIGKGVNPPAPDLTKSAAVWSPAELFWIIKNGIKMTAMPAWGPTHPDEEIWNIVALVRDLPAMSPERYQQIRNRGTEDQAGGVQERPRQTGHHSGRHPHSR